MTRSEVETRIIDLMVETFELDRETVSVESKLYDDLELDSIDALDLVVKLQEFTQRRVEEEELRALVTIADVVDMVVRNAGPAEQQTG